MPYRSDTASRETLQLVEAARQGSRIAFDGLVRKYQNRLFTSVVHIVGSADEADEIVQETFIQTFLKLRSFEGRSSFFTWMFRIALNRISTRRRRKKREVSLDDERADVDHHLSRIDTPGERLLRKEQGNQVHEALCRLTAEHRQVLMLREFEGFDYETMAQLLDTSVGTIRSRLHRARKAMRQEMTTYEQIHP